jgi:DNA-binding CsgD family transcriptional regulator
VFKRLRAAPLAERASAELRASGEAIRRRDPGTPSQLTPLERPIVRVASQGDYQQIADRGFLSRHTVGYHLHKIYAKLGITSPRRAAPARPGRRRPP